MHGLFEFVLCSRRATSCHSSTFAHLDCFSDSTLPPPAKLCAMSAPHHSIVRSSDSRTRAMPLTQPRKSSASSHVSAVGMEVAAGNLCLGSKVPREPEQRAPPTFRAPDVSLVGPGVEFRDLEAQQSPAHASLMPAG